jgi:hypothetical protein
MSEIEHPRITEVGRLLAENDRLREALEKIAYLDSPQVRGLPSRRSIHDIAMAALAKDAGK